MNSRRILYFSISLFCGLLLATGLILMSSSQAMAVRAAPEARGVRYVATNGDDSENDCNDPASPCRTVPHAIFVALEEEEIHVAGGTYTDTIFDATVASGVTATAVISKGIYSLMGGYAPDFSTRDIATYETILDASPTPGAFAVVFSGTNAILDGFTLTGVTGADYSDPLYVYFGGAIRTWGGSPTISHNYITDNFAYGRGAGIYISSGSPTIVGNTIYSNTTMSEGGGNNQGAGIFVAAGTEGALISDNIIISNTTEIEAGGVFIGWNVPAVISYNEIAYNQVTTPTIESKGGGLVTNGDGAVVLIMHNHIHDNATNGFIEGSGLGINSPAIVESNYIHDNIATDWPSAVNVRDVKSVVFIFNNIIADNPGTGVKGVNFQEMWLTNNTITGNSFQGVEVYNWPITSTVPFTLNMYNNIVVNNGDCGITSWNDTFVLIDYNDVMGHIKSDYCLLAMPGEHDISEYPQFVDVAAGDYHLLAGSPAIDAGDNSVAPLDDFDAKIRPIGEFVDMGAFEFGFRSFLPFAYR